MSTFATFATFILIRLKSAGTISFWLAALVVPAIILSMGFLFGRSGGLSIQIGIYGHDLDFFQDRLTAYGGEYWTVIPYSNRAQMRQDVAARRIELGYVLPGYASGYASGYTTDEKITLYTSPETVVDAVTNLLIAAIYIEASAGEIGARALASFAQLDIKEENGIQAQADEFLTNEGEVIQARVDEFLAEGPLMEQIVITYGRHAQILPLDSNPSPFRRLFHGLLALFGQLLAMLCALGFTRENEGHIHKKLKSIKLDPVKLNSTKLNPIKLSSSVLYSLSGPLAVFILTGLVMLAAILPSVLIFPGIWIRSDIPAALMYLLAVSTLAVLLARKLPTGAYPSVLVMSFIFTALMGGVIFDLREVFEAVGFLRLLFPSYYYLRGI